MPNQVRHDIVGGSLRCLVIVAHPDDEVIWMGGLILRHSHWDWHVLSLCRAGDPDREPRFHNAAFELGVHEHIADLDDSPILEPLRPDLNEIRDRIWDLLPHEADLVFTHGRGGEYSFHLRHIQVSQAVSAMIRDEQLNSTLVTFAYEDGGRAYAPRPAANAQIWVELKPDEFEQKRHLIRSIYNFPPGSFEFEAAGSVEAFSVPDSGAIPHVKTLLGVR